MESSTSLKGEQSLASGRYIGGRHILFEQKEIIEGKVALYLPTDFHLMHVAAARLKYPSKYRPAILYADAENEISFAFSLGDDPLAPDQTETLAKAMANAIGRLHPTYTFGESGTRPFEKTTLSWFTFHSIALDMDLYNFTYLTTIDGKILHGVFNCPAAQQSDWEEAVFSVLNTLEDRAIPKVKYPEKPIIAVLQRSGRHR